VMKRGLLGVHGFAAAALVVLAGCSSVGFGISVPIGGIGSVGVTIGSDGRVGGNVSVGTGGVSVGVGGTADLPRPKPEDKKDAKAEHAAPDQSKPAAPASPAASAATAASAPLPSASSPTGT
jgi:hypothetical protein